MGHNIFLNERTGEHSFFSVQQKAWHGLVQIVSEHPTSAQAIAHAGLDYSVEKRPLFIELKVHYQSGFLFAGSYQGS